MVGTLKVSKILKEDLIKGKAPYIRNGKLYFDTINVGKSSFSFLNKNKLLVTTEFPHEVSFHLGETVTFNLIEGKMKIKID